MGYINSSVNLTIHMQHLDPDSKGFIKITAVKICTDNAECQVDWERKNMRERQEGIYENIMGVLRVDPVSGLQKDESCEAFLERVMRDALAGKGTIYFEAEDRETKQPVTDAVIAYVRLDKLTSVKFNTHYIMAEKRMDEIRPMPLKPGLAINPEQETEIRKEMAKTVQEALTHIKENPPLTGMDAWPGIIADYIIDHGAWADLRYMQYHENIAQYYPAWYRDKTENQ